MTKLRKTQNIPLSGSIILPPGRRILPPGSGILPPLFDIDNFNLLSVVVDYVDRDFYNLFKALIKINFVRHVSALGSRQSLDWCWCWREDQDD